MRVDEQDGESAPLIAPATPAETRRSQVERQSDQQHHEGALRRHGEAGEKRVSRRRDCAPQRQATLAWQVRSGADAATSIANAPTSIASAATMVTCSPEIAMRCVVPVAAKTCHCVAEIPSVAPTASPAITPAARRSCSASWMSSGDDGTNREHRIRRARDPPVSGCPVSCAHTRSRQCRRGTSFPRSRTPPGLAKPRAARSRTRSCQRSAARGADPASNHVSRKLAGGRRAARPGQNRISPDRRSSREGKSHRPRISQSVPSCSGGSWCVEEHQRTDECPKRPRGHQRRHARAPDTAHEKDADEQR